MKNVFRIFLFCCGTCLIFPKGGAADVFQGEVVNVDQNQGTFTVRTQTHEGPQETIFRLPATPVVETVPSVSALQELEAGDQVQVDAVNQNGAWQIQTLKTTPQNTSHPSVFISSTVPARPADVFAAAPVVSPVPVNLVLQSNGPVSNSQSGLVNVIPPTAVAGASSMTTPVQVQQANGSTITGLATVNPVSGVNTFNSTFSGTTLTPAGVTTSGVVSSIPTSNPAAPPTLGPITTGTPARSGALPPPARNGAQNS